MERGSKFPRTGEVVSALGIGKKMTQSKFHVLDKDAPAMIRAKEGTLFTAARTCGDGACAIHATFGEASSTSGFILPDARGFALTTMGATIEEFRARVNDAQLLNEYSVFLWNDVVKPLAKLHLVLETGGPIPGYESLRIWEAVRRVPVVLDACVQRIREEERNYARIRERRNLVYRSFARLCIRSLEHSFLRPLLLTLGLLEDFLTSPCEVADIPTISYKFDALFHVCSEGDKLRSSILEHCGASNYSSLSDKVQDIVGDIQWTPELTPLFEFCERLCELAREDVSRYTVPASNFLDMVYPLVIEILSKDARYFLSDLELLLLSKCANVNLVIARHDRAARTLEYHRCLICNPERPLVHVGISMRSGTTTVRSHFERLEIEAPMVSSELKDSRSAPVMKHTTETSTSNAAVNETTGHSDIPGRGVPSLYEQFFGDNYEETKLDDKRDDNCSNTDVDAESLPDVSDSSQNDDDSDGEDIFNVPDLIYRTHVCSGLHHFI